MSARQRPTVPLRTLLVLLAAFGLLPLGAVGAWSLHTAAQSHQREQERAALDLARALSGTVDAELDAAVATLSSMSRAPALSRADIPAFYETALAQGAAQSDWLGVFLADAAGHPLFRTTAAYGAPPAPVADPGSLAQAISLRRPVIGHVARGKGGRLAFPVRIPVFDEAGHLYVLSAVIRPDRLVQALGRQHVPAGVSVAVFDAGGSPVATVGPLAPASPIGPAPEQVGTVRAGGTERIEAQTRLSRHAWTVTVTQPAAVALAGLGGYGATIAASLALAAAIASLLAGRIAGRFRQLQRETAALGAGKPVVPVRSRIREIAVMGVSLDAAADQHAVHARERAELLASLEQASRAKDDFLAVLGHELRNPLSPITAALDLMDMRDEPANRRERVILRRQVQHLKRLVDDLLDVSRITSGKLQLDIKPLDLAALVRECGAASPQAVAVTAPGTLWIEGDDSRLAQVLNNLLSNAARFGSDATAIDLREEGGRVYLAVSDNGAGMSPALLTRVFEPFYQAPQQLARRTGGLGLGLAIVRRIVELHGGRVSAHSEGPGRGSRFEVELVAARAAAGEPGLPAGARATGPASLPATQRQRVLLVDDNVDAATVTAALLERIGHEVRVAHTAQAALAAARDFKPALAILDIGLPDMDGYALAGALRGIMGEDVRLVALSGYGQRADVERAVLAGFDLHLTKPATLEDLQRAAGAGMRHAA